MPSVESTPSAAIGTTLPLDVVLLAAAAAVRRVPILI
jgi:hypothetical protein